MKFVLTVQKTARVRNFWVLLEIYKKLLIMIIQLYIMYL